MLGSRGRRKARVAGIPWGWLGSVVVEDKDREAASYSHGKRLGFILLVGGKPLAGYSQRTVMV